MSQYRSTGRGGSEPSGWGVGWTVFAAVMMIMAASGRGCPARVVGITLAVLSAMASFLFIPYYPFWSMLIIAVDSFVIWALAAHGRELKKLKDY